MDIVRMARGGCQFTRAEAVDCPQGTDRRRVFASAVQEAAPALLVLMFARVNEPSLGAPATRGTPEKHRARPAADGVVMAVQVASDPAPHGDSTSTQLDNETCLRRATAVPIPDTENMAKLTNFVNGVAS
jgi:hypothetical protein